VESRTFHTRSEEETIALGRDLARELRGVVLLIGTLGAGKTTLTKGIVEGAGIATANDVSSPTFTLIHQYGSGRRAIYHADLYRLDEERDVETLGLDDLFATRCLVLLEWAERFPSLLPAQRTEIRIRALPDESREVTVDAIASDDGAQTGAPGN
jgi:tRNA threonylcarbamoyladenosine biosynthesis protein TsaE